MVEDSWLIEVGGDDDGYNKDNYIQIFKKNFTNFFFREIEISDAELLKRLLLLMW